MKQICHTCGKTTEGEEIIFCPYCGARLARENAPEEPKNPEAEKWIRKALAAVSYPERQKILKKGLEACPENREIEWELLFIGEPEKRRGGGVDYSVIRSWILELYRHPGELSDEKRRKMRSGFFEDPNLVRVLARFEDPEAKQQEYLQRLCTEYVELFLEGNNQVMGKIFGFRLGRDPERRLAIPVAEMIGRIRQDEELLPEQREQLWKALYRAYEIRTNGNTEYLDEMIG